VAASHDSPTGLLQTLYIPSEVWANISIDFVEGLSMVHGKCIILTVIDRLLNYAHFIAPSHHT
jgi:hypothetical protein